MIKELPHISYLLKKMCKAVGADPKKIDFKEESWFTLYEWSEQQELDFKKEMVEYLFTNREARNELMKRPSKLKRDLHKIADEFCFQYGWKYDKERIGTNYKDN